MKIRVKDADHLNSLIIMKGFNKTEFSKIIQLSQPMMIQITNGSRNPSPRIAKRIKDALEMEWEDLFTICL